MSWGLFDLVQVVGGKLLNPPEEDIQIRGVHFDSRQIKEHSLFVPLIAERNGHEFVNDAQQAGAVAAFWSDDLEKAPKDIPLILVEDTLEALKDFARWHLNEVQPRVVAITGSNGKTTTKDMTDKILEAQYETHKTAGNFNNEIGLPLTLLAMPKTSEVIVVEMGTSNPGEISILSNLVSPDVAVVTMIGESHIESFGTRANLAKEKMMVCSGLKENGLFIYPAEEPLITSKLANEGRTQNFSLNEPADLVATAIHEEIDATFFTVQDRLSNTSLEMKIPVPGKYNINNALIAILVGLEFGISLKEAKKQLSNLDLTKDRLEWIQGINDLNLLNDAYNASPSSVRAVLKYFQNIETNRDKVLVLGDILELGDLSQEMHKKLADAIELETNHFVFLYGEQMRYLYKQLKKEHNSGHVYHFSGNKASLLKALKNKIRKGSLVLFKSSNGTDLLSVVGALRINNE